jgi:hypothetical protein
VRAVWRLQAAELPVLEEDRQLDADSVNPGQQLFEKLTAGLYMGDIARRIMHRQAAGQTHTSLRPSASSPTMHLLGGKKQLWMSLEQACLNWLLVLGNAQGCGGEATV